jgi:hypothetical protein
LILWEKVNVAQSDAVPAMDEANFLSA